MKNLKPFQVIVMAVFGFVALAGILLFANFKGFSSGVTAVGTVSIWGTLPEDAMNEALNQFRQTHQEYGRVTYTERPDETFNADLAEAIASGSGPDLIILTQEDLVSAQAKLMTIPSSVISERDFRDEYLPINELFLVSGGTYAMPFLTDPLVLFYSRPILASAGAARPPATWEAVTGLASTINRQTDTQTVTRSLIALGTYDNVENARAILSMLFLQAGYTVSEYRDSGRRATLTNPIAQVYGRTPAESALNFYSEFANPAKSVYSWNSGMPESRQAFLAGDVALYLGFASERKELAQANPNLDFDMAAAPAPATGQSRITFGRAYAFAIPRASANSEGALEVAITLSGADAGPIFARALGMAPSARMALAPNPSDLYEPVYYPEALIARGWLSPAPSVTDRIFATMVSNVASGRETVNAAIVTANTALNAAFK